MELSLNKNYLPTSQWCTQEDERNSLETWRHCAESIALHVYSYQYSWYILCYIFIRYKRMESCQDLAPAMKICKCECIILQINNLEFELFKYKQFCTSRHQYTWKHQVSHGVPLYTSRIWKDAQWNNLILVVYALFTTIRKCFDFQPMSDWFTY
jgi:hypothetical protein